MLLPVVFNSNEGTAQTVSLLAPASTQQQWNTRNRGTYRYSVQRGITDSSVPKTAGDKWPAPARRLTQTRLGVAEWKTGDQTSISLASLHFFTYALLTTAL